MLDLETIRFDITNTNAPQWIKDYKLDCLQYLKHHDINIISQLFLILLNQKIIKNPHIEEIKSSYVLLKNKLLNEYGVNIEEIDYQGFYKYESILKNFFIFSKTYEILILNPYYLFNVINFEKLAFIYVPQGVSCEIAIGLYTKLLFSWPEYIAIFIDSNSNINVSDGCFSRLVNLMRYEISTFYIIVKDRVKLQLSKILNWHKNITNACTFVFELEDSSEINFLYADIGDFENLAKIIVLFKGMNACFNLYSFKDTVHIINSKGNSYNFYNLAKIKDDKDSKDKLFDVFPYEITSELSANLNWFI
mgnify:CR=1 FL=1